MEFTGRIKKVLPLRSGISQRTGNEWKSQPFIFEYFEHPTDRYADSVLLETFDENVINKMKEGMEVKCGFSHNTREYDGKIYNDIRLYKIESVRKAQKAGQSAEIADGQQKQGATQAPQQQEGGNDYDLPF